MILFGSFEHSKPLICRKTDFTDISLDPLVYWAKLRLLNLSVNTFTCNIPPSLKNITKLETLDLSQNNLSDEIFRNLGKLSFLANINFSYNHLEGLVPQSTHFGSQKCSSFHSWVIMDSTASRKLVEKTMSLFLRRSNPRKNLCQNQKSMWLVG